MNRITFSLFLILVTFLLCTCGKDKEEDYSDWKKQNDAAFQLIVNNSDYDSIATPGSPPVYVKKIISGDPSGPMPLIGSIVSVRYTGTYITGEVFDTTEKDENPRSFTVKNGSIIDGWVIALQNMRPGDKWEVWVHWPLGYGSTGLVSSGVKVIPPYSTLIFIIELLSVNQFP